MPLILFDTVTLEHFAATGRLDLLEETYSGFDEPRWVEQVREEVRAGAGMSKSQALCQPVLDLAWLGEPVEGPLKETLRLKILLGGTDDDDEHLGEAESIAVAAEAGAVFVTDDAGAFDFARHNGMLGPANVKDACVVLWEACSLGLITDEEITQFHVDVFDAQRTMRCRCSRWPGGDSLDERIRRLNRGRSF
ncbi:MULTISPECIES: hypothetical protein [Microbacterium]|uniref:PIN domain-containing protein n=1 Tax=Microbacterium maritypicum TaxID=33918 RepID=A0A4Y4BDC3_MICMQ|nr:MULTISPECIES: hypothetical protein [Microbacterium]MBG0718044.1 hypothetical protein [Microbacterium paulum]GEC77094.1 hypothetical protein MLI01_32390 [Microbacterium liquefaciens]GGV64207.1 hypothetical protein GCM10010213_29490 [Microbacterium liquefaciens]